LQEAWKLVTDVWYFKIFTLEVLLWIFMVCLIAGYTPLECS
jgi:hypothetical protein